MIVSRSVLFSMRNVSDKICRENQNARIMFSNFLPKILPCMKYCGKYGTDGQVTDDNAIRHMRFTWWVTKATDSHSEHVILIDFPLHQWLRESASMLGYRHVACLVQVFIYRHLTEITWQVTYLISGNCCNTCRAFVTKNQSQYSKSLTASVHWRKSRAVITVIRHFLVCAHVRACVCACVCVCSICLLFLYCPCQIPFNQWHQYLSLIWRETWVNVHKFPEPCEWTLW